MSESKKRSLWILPIVILMGVIAAAVFFFYGVDGFQAGQVTIVVLMAVVLLTLLALVRHVQQWNKTEIKKSSSLSWSKTLFLVGVSILLGIMALIVLLVVGKGLSGGS